MFFDEIIISSLGVGTSVIAIIAILIFSIIISVKDVKIGCMVANLLLFTGFVFFFQYNRSDVGSWGPLLVAWFVSMVVLFLVLLAIYWGYEDRRKVIN
jgi:hypothetical protein